MRTKLRDWLATSTTRLPDTNLTEIVNMAIREIARTTDLRTNAAETSVSLVAGTQSYVLPSALGQFSRPFFAFIIDPNDSTKMIELEQISYEEFRDRYGITNQVARGTPEAYTIRDANAAAFPLHIGPTPDQAAVMWFDAYLLPADLSADADHNDVTDYAADMVFYKAMSLASQFMLEDERAIQFQQQYEQERRRVLHEHGRARYAGMPFAQMTEPH